MGPASNTRGRLVPLAVPLHTPQLARIRSLRDQAAQISKRIHALVKLEEQLSVLPDEPRCDALVPAPSSSSLAFAKGSVANTNTVMVHFDFLSEDHETDAQRKDARQEPIENDGYWVDYSAKQATGVAQRRQAYLRPKLDRIKAAISEAEEAVSTEMGFHGGRMNQNYELLNEEGLPFVEIQEFEEDGTAPAASASTVKVSSHSRESLALNLDNSPNIPTSISESDPVSSTTLPRKAKKSVSFAQEDSYEPSPQISDNDEADLPVIASQKAAASAGLSREKVAQTSEVQKPNASLTSSFADMTIKPSIVVKDSTKPPPVLTAAERSANRKSKYDVAAEFDGAEPKKKVDLSAYLPRSLRATPIAASFKGKTQAMDQSRAGESSNQSMTSEDNNGYEEEYDDEDMQDSDDPDYLDDDDFDQDSDDDNTHIDDILAMREAAMEYHAKRHALGAGAGTGPLGGLGQPDEFNEPGLTEYDKGGLPIVETYDDELNGNKRPSRFRKSRLATAQMIIPDLKPGDVNVEETILPGDSLGPYEDEETAEAGSHGTNDFKGMSKEEIETFLRYVKALETGEELQDLRVISANDAPPAVAAPLPMDQKKPPAIKESVVKKQEVVPIATTVLEKKVENVPVIEEKKPIPAQGDPPKRVSRFRAARAGNV